MMKDGEVEAIAAQIFSRALGPLGFERVRVTSGEDHDGDRSFFVEAFFKAGTRIAGVTPLVEARGELRDVMLDRGEERFPYVSYRIPDENGSHSERPNECDMPMSGS